MNDTMREAALATLRARGEPGRWSVLHFAAWRALAEGHLLAALSDEPLATVGDTLESLTRDALIFRRFDATPDDDPTTGWWFVAGDDVTPSPLSDRVEAFVLKRLTETGPLDEHDLLKDTCAAFPGPQTPGRALVLACQHSYAYKLESGQWQLRPEEAPASRAQESQAIQAELRALAARHGFSVAGANPQEWRDESGRTIYLFAVITSAVFSTHVLGAPGPAERRFVVLPGGRAGLAGFKLRRDPRLRAAMAAGRWALLKFRHVRRMAADAHLTQTTLASALLEDPVEELKQLKLRIGD
jgi:hypothetical protein